jgi:hypothetical protein
MQAVPEHLLEAAEHAKTMTAEEIEETIHRIVDEHGDDPVSSPSISSLLGSDSSLELPSRSPCGGQVCLSYSS